MNLEHIREQIAWCEANGGFVGKDLAKTMQALLDVAGVGQEIHDWRWKYRDTYRDTESAVKDLDLVIARLTHALTKLQEQNDVHD